jgi:DNA invertase Pin-like site-specific DNA recombinase
MIEAYGYIRVSGDDQAKKDGPVRQREAITVFMAANGLKMGGIFSDLGVSGTIEGVSRPGLMDLITTADLQGVKVIVVEKMDRLARDLIVSEMIIRELAKRGIRLFAVDLGFHDQVSADADPSRKLIRQIFAAMAEFEKSSLVLKLRAARERMRRAKGRCEGTLGYGGTNAGRMTLDLIAKLRTSGSSWGSIAALLNQGGVKKSNGSAWAGTDARKAFNVAVARQRKAHEHNSNNGLYHGTAPDLSGS